MENVPDHLIREAKALYENKTRTKIVEVSRTSGDAKCSVK